MTRYLKLFCCILLLLGGTVMALAQGTKYEAENGVLTGTVVETSVAGYSGTGYVTGFDNDGDKLAVTFTLSQAGNYNIYVGYAGPYGDKKNNLSINGNVTEMSFPSSSGFTEAAYGKAALKEGSNTLAIIKSWGWFLVDYIRIEPNADPEITVQIPYQLVTPLPLDATRRLWSYLLDSFTHKIHSGAMSLNAKEEADWLFANTGKYPALIGMDFMNHTRNWSWFDKSVLVNETRNWYNNNGLVALCWHWRDPSRATDEFYTSAQTLTSQR